MSRRGGYASHGGRSRYDDEWEDRERSWRYDDDERGDRSRRGFAAMDPEEQREIARRGGMMSHGGRGRAYDEDEYGREFGGRSREWYDEDNRRYRSRGGYDDDERGGRSRRGFAAMDPEERREIARMGGRASHEYGRGHEFTSEEAREAGRLGGFASHGGRGRRWDDDDEDDRRSSRFRGRYDEERGVGRSRRGFAAMDPEERREIARMGGRASHEYGRGHEFTSEEAREAGRRGGQARWQQ